ncbi:MAG: metal-dependent transcriptional regulator [Coriobacteriia bacterium]|nr:metal-dependent transcriptional regulator [Coriobacteriia bacterium]
MAIRESGENYLETILILQQRNGVVRSVDVARELGFTKASISRAMNVLSKAGYVEIADDGAVLLTKEGSARAHEILHRHQVIARFLVQALGVDEEIADTDACRIEHVVGPEVFAAMEKLVS